jgi:hypothetical protein
MIGDAAGPLTATTTASHEWTRHPRPIVVSGIGANVAVGVSNEQEAVS